MLGIIILVAGLFLICFLFPGIGSSNNKSTGNEKDDLDMDLIVVDDEQIWIEK